jgi:hypothetical protein
LALPGVFSKLGAGLLKSMPHYYYQSVMYFSGASTEGPDLRFSVAKWLKAG